METQKLELVDILPELKEKRDNFLKFGSVVKPQNWQKIEEARAFNLKQKAKRRAYWQKVNEVRKHNLALKQVEGMLKEIARASTVR